MMELNKKQIKILFRMLEEIASSQIDDRRDLDKLTISSATMIEQNNKILGMLNRTQGKIQDAVSNAVSETVEPLNEKMDEFVGKKVIKVTEDKIKNLSFIQKFFKNKKNWG